jgi:hypothetical protein
VLIRSAEFLINPGEAARLALWDGRNCNQRECRAWKELQTAPCPRQQEIRYRMRDPASLDAAAALPPDYYQRLALPWEAAFLAG